MKKFPKISLIVVMVSVIVLIFNVGFANAKTTNKGLVKKYCKENYRECKVKYFTKWNEYKMTHRKGKNIVYVQVEISCSSGKKDKTNGRYWGYIKGSNYYRTWYNKKVRRGKKVTSYYIYNPYTNWEDDIIAVVDNNKIRD